MLRRKNRVLDEHVIKILFSGGFPKPLSNYQSSVSAHTSPVHQLTPQLASPAEFCQTQLSTSF